MDQEGQQAQVFPDPDLGSTKMRVHCNFCFIKFLPNYNSETPESHQDPFGPLQALGVRVEGVLPDQIADTDIHYKFDFENSPSAGVTMAPEGHPDPDLGSKKVTYPTESWVP